MSAIRQPDSEEYHRAAAVARELRGVVADQLHDLVVEAERMAGDGELIADVQAIGQVQKRIMQARARQVQARELGLPLTPSVRDEREQLGLLRVAVMKLAATCGLYAASMDFDERKAQEMSINGSGGSDG